jgi:hypothetical protein
MAIEISKNHLESVVNHLTWQNKAQLHFRRFMHGVAPMPLNDRFWKLLDQFRELIRHNLDRKHGESIAGAAREFFRLALVTEAPVKGDEYLMDEALQWFQGYRALRSQLDRAIGNLYEFHGDSFGDLIDSMPLGGRDMCERAMKTAPRCRDGFLSDEEVSEAIRALPDPWRKLVGHALFVASTLEENADAYLIAWMRQHVLTCEQREQIESFKID